MTEAGRLGTSLLAHGVAAVILVALVLRVATATAGAYVGSGWGILVCLAVTLFVGWYLAWRRPRIALGWLLLVIPAFYAVQVPLGLLAAGVHDTAPEVARWLLWYRWTRDSWGWILPIGLLFTQIPLRFPDGRLPTPRWKWFSWYTIIALLAVSYLVSTTQAEVAPGVPSPTHVDWGAAQPTVLVLGYVVCLLPSFVGSIASLFVRYRRGGAVERAQLRWVFWATAVVAALFVVNGVAVFVVPDDALEWGSDANPVATVTALSISIGYGLIPVAMLFAVLRYGLYSIDRIISRTASYVLVTGTAVVAYVAVVLTLTLLLPSLESLWVAVATLAAAALFLPLLRVVQRLVDRRFDRERYNTVRVVDAFGQRLRDGADPHTAAADLVTAVGQTLQPASVGVWILPRVGPRGPVREE